MPKYRAKRNFGRDGRHFKKGEIVELDKAVAESVGAERLEPLPEAKPSGPAKPPEK